MKKQTKATAPAKPKRAKSRVKMSEELMLDVRHDFSDSEKIELGQRLTTTMTTREALEDQKKITVKDFDSKLKIYDGEISTIHGKLRDSYEFRATPVIVHFNKGVDATTKKAVKRNGYKLIVLKDGGKIVRDEPMSPTDIQSEMFQKEQLKRKEKRESEAAKETDKQPGETKPLNAPEVPAGEGTTSTAATA